MTVTVSEGLSEEIPTEGSTFRTILGNRDFSRLWFGQLVSNVGFAISSLALLFFAYDLTGSALAMAILAMAQTAPVVIFAGFIGVYVDRWNRKTIMIASDIARAFLILLIPLAPLFPPVLAPIEWIYLLTFLYAVANAWFYPARSASIPNLVESDELVTANSLSQMTFQVVQLTIPPLGGVLVALLAPDYFLAFAINSVTIILSALALRGIKTSLVPKEMVEKESVRSQVVQGARYAANNVILVYLFVFAILVASSSGILNALLIPHLEGQLGITELQFGLVLSAGAASGIVVALVMGNRKRLPKPLYIVASAGIVAGIAVLGLAGAQGFWHVLLSWALIGSVDVMLNIPLGTLMQELVVDNYRGRVFALFNVVFTAVQVFGMGLGGVWAETAGSTVPPMFGAAIGLLIVSLIGAAVAARKKLHSQLDVMLDDSDQEVAREETECTDVLLEVPT
ncbi:MAG: MFS transporter [Candidatus Thorarchaeota archaeon]|nr:MAG: MFS transporter [Candidatus Thorarchaeota archaeon]